MGLVNVFSPLRFWQSITPRLHLLIYWIKKLYYFKILLRFKMTVLCHRFTYAAWAFTLWERPLACWLSEALIESRQSIGWWRDAAPDALTSSAYTGERVIYSSDFSAFMKRPYCPSVAFLLQFYILSDTDSSFALRRLHTVELCSPRSEVPWNIAVVNRRVLDLSRAMTRTVSVLNIWDFRMHARRFMGFLNAKFGRLNRLNSLMNIFILARGHVTPSPSG